MEQKVNVAKKKKRRKRKSFWRETIKTDLELSKLWLVEAKVRHEMLREAFEKSAKRKVDYIC